MTGTFANMAAIAAGSLIGVIIHSKLPQRFINIIFQGMGLVTLTLGISMAIQADHTLYVVLSIVLGAITGELLQLSQRLDRLSRKWVKGNDSSWVEGFISSSLLFCIGSMAVLGSIEDGLGKTPTILYTKSIMDGISSIAFAASFGIAIAASAIPILIIQGSITLFAAALTPFFTETLIADLSGVGGILLIGLGINILKIKEINVVNLLPSLLFILLSALIS